MKAYHPLVPHSRVALASGVLQSLAAATNSARLPTLEGDSVAQNATSSNGDVGSVVTVTAACAPATHSTVAAHTSSRATRIRRDNAMWLRR